MAIENSKLGIPLLFGLDVTHGYKTIFPIPFAESNHWHLEAIESSLLIEVVISLTVTIFDISSF